MTFLVVTSSESDADVATISRFIHSHSPQGAVGWLDAYDQAIERLTVNAEGCPLADECEWIDMEVRQLSFKTRRGKAYRLIFTIVGDEARILRVRGPGQSAIDSG